MGKRFRVFVGAAVILLSSVLSLIPSGGAVAAGGKYWLECDENGGNEYIIYYTADGSQPNMSKWDSYDLAHIDVSGKYHYDTVPMNGSQVSCKGTNDQTKAFNSINDAKDFIVWTQNHDTNYKGITWDYSLDGGALNTLMGTAQIVLSCGNGKNCDNLNAEGSNKITVTVMIEGDNNNLAWNYSTDVSWAHIERNGDKLTIKADPNMRFDGSQRTGSVTVKTSNGTTQNTMQFHQDKAVCQQYVCFTLNGEQIPYQLEAASQGQTFSFNMYGASGVNVGNSDVSLRIDTACSGAAFIKGGTTAILTIPKNEEQSPRYCQFWYTYRGQPPFESFYILQPPFYDENGNEQPTNPINPGAPDSPANSEGQATTCDLGKMGWALCPLMEGMDAMLGDLYGMIESNFLRIDPEFYNMDEDGTYGAWKTFRNIANIIFVIVFLMVIFSQVTNVGINNYGIKKMLPEIIMAAILINLSYFICQAMVDLSNIFGNQIKHLLESLIAVGTPTDADKGWLAIVTGVLGLGAVGGGIALAAVLTGGIGAVFAGIFLALLAGIIATLTIFLLLIARQIGVVVLIALAPVAFAARILPNTSNLFKTWWKSFVSLLVVYPACGLVIGGGKLAGRIMAKAANAAGGTTAFLNMGGDTHPASIMTFAAASMGVMFAIAAVIAMIAPYFAVIPIIKGSINGLGKLGGAISGKINGVGSSLNKAGGAGINAGAKKVGQLTGYTAGRAARTNAKAAIAKAKADQRSAKLAANTTRKRFGFFGKEVDNVYGEMAQAEFEAGQNREEMAKASVGEYDGKDENILKISRANAIRLGNYKAGGTVFEADAKAGGSRAPKKKDTDRSDGNMRRIAGNPDKYGFEAEQQFQAQTAGVAAEAKDAKKFDESFATMSANGDVMNTVYDSGTGAVKAGVKSLQVERAVNDLLRRGDIDQATKLTQAYTRDARYTGDTHAQQRLANVLASTKGKANYLHAFSKATNKAIQAGSRTGFSLDDMSRTAGATYRDSSGTAITVKLADQLQADYSAQDIVTEDKDAYTYLAGLGASGANYNAEQYAAAFSSNAASKKVTEMSAALATDPALRASVAGRFTGQQVNKLGDSAFDVIAGDLNAAQYASALTSGATADQLARMETAFNTDAAAGGTKRIDAARQITASQMQSLDSNTFLQIATDQLRRTTGNAALTFGNMAMLQGYLTHNAPAQAALQGTFSTAYNAASPRVGGNKDVAKHWNPDIQKALNI